MTNSIILLGSSNSFGQTRKAIDIIIGNKDIPIIDLKTLDISPYDYNHNNKDDDYFPLMKKVIEHDLIVLATPVYWYSVSSFIKTFIDRLSDLLEIQKDLGRKLRGKKLFVIASFSTSLPEFFEKPIELTCEYMGIKYQGCSFIYNGEDLNLQQNNKAEIIKAKEIIL